MPRIHVGNGLSDGVMGGAARLSRFVVGGANLDYPPNLS